MAEGNAKKWKQLLSKILLQFHGTQPGMLYIVVPLHVNLKKDKQSMIYLWFLYLGIPIYFFKSYSTNKITAE